MSRDIERARRFIITGGPGREQYGQTPRSIRGFEPVTAGGYGETKLGQWQRQESQLPRAEQDLLDWNQRLQSEARRRKLRERLKAASGLDGSNNAGPVNRQEEDHPSNNHTE